AKAAEGAEAGAKAAAEEEARQAQEEARRREAEALRAEGERARAEAEARRARAEAERRGASKARGGAKAGRKAGRGPREGRPAAEGPCRAENLLAQSRHATVKDAAEFAAGVVNGHPQPDDVLEALLTLLGQSAQLSAKGKRACKAALVSLARKEGP